MTVTRLQTSQLPIILIDDGSNSSCHDALVNLAANQPFITLLHLPVNGGKGGAIKAGLRAAQNQGYSHALQIDADGQHAVTDIAHFIDAGRRSPAALICGYPAYDDSVPSLRFYARYLTHLWVWINSLSLAVKDSMCGFRLYPVTATLALINSQSMGNRMEFESEIAVHWVWSGGEVINLQTKVTYPADGISHFAPWRDNVLISKMHASLFFGMLWRSPRLLRRKLLQRKQREGA